MSTNGAAKPPITLPDDYDYVACYLTDFCFLNCSYCITDHNGTGFTSGKDEKFYQLDVDSWVEAFRRIRFPNGVVPTLQGGEPFLYRKIWDLIERSPVPVDILTALPPVVKRSKFEKLSSLVNLNRGAVYPNVRVSYHLGQNDIEDLARRVSELQDLISIGIYFVDYPGAPGEAEHAREVCEKHGVVFKTKEYLGFYDGKLYGTYKHPDAVVGHVTRPEVLCRNTVLIIAPSGDVYRCHSDLYHKRNNLKVGNITDADFAAADDYGVCNFYGLCSECDLKVKNNHFQQFGYTSVDIIFPENKTEEAAELNGRDRLRVLGQPNS